MMQAWVAAREPDAANELPALPAGLKLVSGWLTILPEFWTRHGAAAGDVLAVGERMAAEHLRGGG